MLYIRLVSYIVNQCYSFTCYDLLEGALQQEISPKHQVKAIWCSIVHHYLE